MIIFGGSFDPFHNGHYGIVKHLLNAYKDDILLVPQNNKDKTHKFPLRHRIESLKYLFKEEPRIRILEMNDDEFFFYEVLNKIQNQKNLKVVIGDDVKPFEWKKSDSFHRCEFIVINRLEANNIELNLPKISSSKIKLCDDIIYHNVPQKIWHYLCYNDLVNDYFRFTNAVDIILYHENMILLTKRGINDIEQEFVLPGGHIDKSDKYIEEAIIRELMEETNIEVKFEDLKQFKTFGDIHRDPRKRVISTCFYTTKFKQHPFKMNEEVLSLFWIKLDEALKLPLGFDHQRILEEFNTHIIKNKL